MKVIERELLLCFLRHLVKTQLISVIGFSLILGLLLQFWTERQKETVI